MTIIPRFRCGANQVCLRDDIAFAREALSKLGAHRADDRLSWLRVGMALKAVSEDLLSDWDTWSMLSEKYRRGECVRQWRSFRSRGNTRVGLGTLVWMAREDSRDASFGKRRGGVK